MLSLIWPAQERKLNTEQISNILTFKLLKELPRHVPRKEFKDLFTFQLQVLMRIPNLWISKQKLLDNKLLRKHFQTQQFSDLVQFMVQMITSLQTFKDNHSFSGITLSLFMTTVLLVSNQSEMLT